MKRAMWAVAMLMAFASPAGAVGFQTVSVPDDGNPALEVGVWYPSDAAARARSHSGCFVKPRPSMAPLPGAACR